jgi:antitoxin (DNA-binding transcriptional repressor) of toxin-antitoxin stability system
MITYTNIGAYEAKTHFPELLRKVKAGSAFRITNRGEHVADLVLPGSADRQSGAQAAERMLRFVRNHSAVENFDIKALIGDGRD